MRDIAVDRALRHLQRRREVPGGHQPPGTQFLDDPEQPFGASHGPKSIPARAPSGLHLEKPDGIAVEVLGVEELAGRNLDIGAERGATGRRQSRARRIEVSGTTRWIVGPCSDGVPG
jgi:hypothetical protein